MKKLLVLSMLTLSISAFAGTGFVTQATSSIDAKGVCADLASAKLIDFAIENGLTSVKMHELEGVRLVESDMRKLSPSHYSWYELDIEIKGEMKTIRTMVQKDRLSKTCN